MLFDIFVTFFKIGSFTIGGGYAMLPVIQKEVVDNKKWLTDEEFLDSIAVTNSLPGPFAINSATFVGYRRAGIPGAVTAALGATMPSFVIILLIAVFFSTLSGNRYVEYVFAGVRPAVVALIFFALVKLTKSVGINKVNLTISSIALAMLLILNFHPIAVIIACGAIGFFFLRKEDK